MDVRVAVRTAITALLEDALMVLYAPYEVVSVTYRPSRMQVAMPAVVFHDEGVRSDDVVPLSDRTLTVDVFTAGDLDLAEAIAHEVNRVLDHQPINLPGEEGLVAYLGLQRDTDGAENDADLCRKTLQYRMMVYEWNGPQFG